MKLKAAESKAEKALQDLTKAHEKIKEVNDIIAKTNEEKNVAENKLSSAEVL